MVLKPLKRSAMQSAFITPKAQAAATSWWIGLDQDAFYAKAHEEHDRMNQTTSDRPKVGRPKHE